jgi:polyisoprenyl-phosphate glycosyltransferase
LNISIIIPCYNEEENIDQLINRIRLIDDKNIEIILVNNGSTDETEKILSNIINFERPQIKIVTIEKNIGYGNGIMEGVKNATGNYIAWTHADLQTDVMDVLQAYYFLTEKKNHDKNFVLKGKRKGRGGVDSFFTFSMSLVVSIILRMKLSDINAQPKMFPKNFLVNLNDAPDDFSLDLYFLYKAKIHKYDILEFPVNFGDRHGGKSKGGGSIIGKWNLIKRTMKFLIMLKNYQND